MVEHQPRYIPNPHFYVPTKYLQAGSRLEIAAGEFTGFLTEQISKEMVVTPQLVQTCLGLSKTTQCPKINRGKFIGVKLLLETPQVDRPTLQIRAKYAFTHNSSRFAAVDVLREGLVRPSATELPDWIYTPGFYCRAAICQTHDESSFQQALNEALAKAIES